MDKRIFWIVLFFFFELVMSNGEKDDCPFVPDEPSVVRFKPFRIPLDPYPIPTTSYGLTDGENRIIYLKIIDEESIPIKVFALKHLQQLEIHNTSFQPRNQHHIPVNIRCFSQSLKELQISDTIITHLPSQINQLTKLTRLKLSNTTLRSLPKTIGSLSSLRNLQLPNNHLTHLPNSMQSLRSLRHIILSNNPDLHSIEQLNGLPALKSLNVENCSIRKLPHHLPKITHLYFSNNSLQHLDGISSLGQNTSESKSFFFSFNQITDLPTDINRIEHLQRLNLDRNNLTTLTDQMFELRHLSHLNIQCNPINERQRKTYANRFHLRNPSITFLHHCP